MNNITTVLIIGGVIIAVVILGAMVMGGDDADTMPVASDTPSMTREAPEEMPMKDTFSMKDSSAMDADMTEETMSNTIVDKAIELEMTTLVEAVQAAGLVETLSSEGPFTVFVPTQEAFDAIAPTLAQIQAAPDASEQLANILTYHVVAGEVPASAVVNLDSATTVQGSDVEISVHDGGVMINDANVVQTDIRVDNGIIHVIDAVLIPTE